MTRDELREKVAKSMGDMYVVIPENYKSLADAAIDTIFAALKDTTKEMDMAAYESEGVGYFGENYTFIEPEYVWQSMLSASPLAPKEK